MTPSVAHWQVLQLKSRRLRVVRFKFFFDVRLARLFVISQAEARVESVRVKGRDQLPVRSCSSFLFGPGNQCDFSTFVPLATTVEVRIKPSEPGPIQVGWEVVPTSERED